MPTLSGLGRCPVSSGPLRKIQDRGVFPRRLKPASFKLTLSPLSQAWRLGGLRHASPVPFRVSCFTMSLHLPSLLQPNDSSPACTGSWSYWLSPFAHSFLALRGALASTPPALHRRICPRQNTACIVPAGSVMPPGRSLGTSDRRFSSQRQTHIFRISTLRQVRVGPTTALRNSSGSGV